MTRPARLGAAALLAAAATLTAQAEPAERPPARPSWVAEGNQWNSIPRDDYREWHFFGGFRFAFPTLDLSLRGGNALVLTDLEQTQTALATGAASGLPRRGIELPAPRRRLSNDELRDRLARSLRAVDRDQGGAADRIGDQMLDIPRYLYCEGGVVVVRDGVEVLRCDRLWISPVDDRVVIENAELRYFRGDQGRRPHAGRARAAVRQAGRALDRPRRHPDDLHRRPSRTPRWRSTTSRSSNAKASSR
jgi:hypothetical protein